MKNKISILCLFALSLLFTSCKKESQNNIVGQWRSASVYTMQNNGTYCWVSVNSHPQFYNFSTEGRFGSATDVPGGSGSYNYDEESQKLTLHYEADHYGNVPATTSLKVETLDRYQLVLSYTSPDGRIYKTEYSRIN